MIGWAVADAPPAWLAWVPTVGVALFFAGMIASGLFGYRAKDGRDG